MSTGLISPAQFAILRAGLDWLFNVEQPADAIHQHLGRTSPTVGNRKYGFSPSGFPNGPVVSVEVVDTDYEFGVGHRAVIAPDELNQLTAALHALGRPVAETWNGHPGITGSAGLTGTAHPTLLAAVSRYQAGCPTHPDKGVFCKCAAWRDSFLRAVPPTWPTI